MVYNLWHSDDLAVAHFSVVYSDETFFADALFNLIPYGSQYSLSFSRRSLSTVQLCLTNSADKTYEKYFRFTYLEPQTSSTSTLDLALEWALACHETHGCCSRLKDRRGWQPTRLMDIGDDCDSGWKLLVRPEKTEYSSTYITLSYRWGSNAGPKLLTSNITALREGRPIAELPKTFRDVVSVARKFAIRYIWIDALCIIQDSTIDWDCEVATMGRVYANSVCNIAASASGDLNEGLFRTRDCEDIRPGLVRAAVTTNTVVETYYILDLSYSDRQLFSGSLFARGWIFQERLLAPRVIYFADSQVFWECFTEHKCEALPLGIPFIQSSKDLEPLWAEQSQQDQISQQQKGRLPPEVLKKWNKLVEAYSQCDFTKMSDKLPAFSGISDLFQKAYGDVYIAGIWKSSLLEQLGYSVWHPVPKRTSENHVPSWSWASLHGPIKASRVSDHTMIHVSLVEAPTREGYLRLQGFLTKATCYQETSSSNFVLSIGGRQAHACISLDSTDIALRENDEVDLLTLQSHPTDFRGPENTWEVYCLVLKPVLRAPLGSYRRIGLLNTYESGSLDVFGVSFHQGSPEPLSDHQLFDVTII
jgi:hypothetical protein